MQNHADDDAYLRNAIFQSLDDRKHLKRKNCELEALVARQSEELRAQQAKYQQLLQVSRQVIGAQLDLLKQELDKELTTTSQEIWNKAKFNTPPPPDRNLPPPPPPPPGRKIITSSNNDSTPLPPPPPPPGQTTSPSPAGHFTPIQMDFTPPQMSNSIPESFAFPDHHVDEDLLLQHSPVLERVTAFPPRMTTEDGEIFSSTTTTSGVRVSPSCSLDEGVASLFDDEEECVVNMVDINREGVHGVCLLVRHARDLDDEQVLTLRNLLAIEDPFWTPPEPKDLLDHERLGEDFVVDSERHYIDKLPKQSTQSIERVRSNPVTCYVLWLRSDGRWNFKQEGQEFAELLLADNHESHIYSPGARLGYHYLWGALYPMTPVVAQVFMPKGRSQGGLTVAWNVTSPHYHRDRSVTLQRDFVVAGFSDFYMNVILAQLVPFGRLGTDSQKTRMTIATNGGCYQSHLWQASNGRYLVTSGFNMRGEQRDVQSQHLEERWRSLASFANHNTDKSLDMWIQATSGTKDEAFVAAEATTLRSGGKNRTKSNRGGAYIRVVHQHNIVPLVEEILV